MPITCDTARDNLDAWALGALDDDDAPALESHLASCAECATLADSASGDAHAVALAVPLRAASSSLKARVLASASVLADIGRRQRPSRWWGAAAAALLLVSAGGMSWGAVLQMRVDGLQSTNTRVGAQATAQTNQLATVHTQIQQAGEERVNLISDLEDQSQAIDILAQPDTTQAQLRGTNAAPQATGSYAWSPAAARGLLVAGNLPPPPDGQLYELWLVYERAWVSGGVLEVDSYGRGMLLVSDIDRADNPGALLGFAVTLEPVVRFEDHAGATVMSGLR